jgi:hypothetical protein
MLPGFNLYLPLPGKLDETSTLSSPLVRSVAHDFLQLAPLAPSEWQKTEELLKQLKGRLSAMAIALEPYFAQFESASTSGDLGDRQRDFDRHFSQIRVDGNTADLLVAATIAAFCHFFEDKEQGSSLLPLEVALLFATTQSVVSRFFYQGAGNHEHP